MAQDAGLEITNDPKTGSGEHIHRAIVPRSINILHRLRPPPLLLPPGWWETKPTTASVDLDPSDGKNSSSFRQREMRRLKKKSTFDVSGSDL